MTKRAYLLLAVAGAAMTATPAVAQRTPDYTRRPAFTTIDLQAGFTPDPRVVNVTAGGRNAAERVGSDCRGSIATAPDVRVHYRSGSFPLTFATESRDDTTLVINGPDGRWYCNDDSDGLNARVTFRAPSSGQYDVYVGHYNRGRRIPARLLISEIVPGGSGDEGGSGGGGNGERPDLSAAAVAGNIAIGSGGRRDTELNVRAGGPLSASTLGGSCVGSIGRVPDVRINYSGRGPLTFSATSSADTTLAINGPDGNWTCADDTNGNDPEVRFDRAAPGQYDVFVGTFSSGNTAPARLRVWEGR